MITTRFTKLRLPTICDPREPSALITIPVRDPANPDFWPEEPADDSPPKWYAWAMIAVCVGGLVAAVVMLVRGPG